VVLFENLPIEVRHLDLEVLFFESVFHLLEERLFSELVGMLRLQKALLDHQLVVGLGLLSDLLLSLR